MTENMVPATSRERGRDVGSEHPASQARAPPLRPPRTQQGPGPRRPALLLAGPPQHPHSPARCPEERGCPPSPSLGSAAGSGPGLPHSLRTGAGGQSTHHHPHPPRQEPRGSQTATSQPWGGNVPTPPSSGTRPGSAPKPIISLKIGIEEPQAATEP